MPPHPRFRSARGIERAIATAAALVLAGALSSVPLVGQASGAPADRSAVALLPVLLPGEPVDAVMLPAPPAPPPVPEPAPPPPAVAPPTQPPAAPAPPAPPAPPPAVVPPAPQQIPLPQRAPERASRGARDDKAERALASLEYPWQELGYEVRFEPYTGRYLGMTDDGARTITVYVRARDTVQSLRVTLAHELGHALDNVTGSEEQRARYREVRGISPDVPWYGCDRCEDYDTPAGDYAEVFAVWLVGGSDYRSRMGPPPDEQQLQQLAPLFAPPSAR